MKRHPWTMIEVRRLLALKAEGKTIPEIAAALDHDRSGVSKYWTRYGQPRPKPSLSQHAAAIRRMVAAGLCLGQMLRRLGVAHRTLRHWLVKLDLQPRDGRDNAHLDYSSSTRAKKISLARQHTWQKQCEEMGWPEVTKPRLAAVLTAIALGKNTRRLLHTSQGDPRYTDRMLRELFLLGLVTRTRESGHHPHVYALAPHLAARRKRS